MEKWQKFYADKHMATVLPNVVLVRRWQRLESLVPYITGMIPLSLSCALSPHTDKIQQQRKFPQKPALDTCRSICQQMSRPHHVLLKTDPHLEGNVTDSKCLNHL